MSKIGGAQFQYIIVYLKFSGQSIAYCLKLHVKSSSDLSLTDRRSRWTSPNRCATKVSGSIPQNPKTNHLKNPKEDVNNFNIYGFISRKNRVLNLKTTVQNGLYIALTDRRLDERTQNNPLTSLGGY